MPEAIISASGVQYGLIIDSQGRATVDATVSAGSEAYNYVDSGGTWVKEPEYRDVIVSGTPAVSSNISNVVGVTPSGTFDVETNLYAGSEFTVSGTVGIIGIGSVRIAEQGIDLNVTQGTDPWIMIGSIAQTNIGSVIQSTSPWVTSGTATIAGSAYVAGSINIVNELTLEDVGSPCFKEATATESGTYTQVWPIGGTGSKLEIHGWKVSTQLPGYVRMLSSGTTPTKIADYYMNYASGAIIEKTFVTPIIPGGADIHAGFGTTIAGSTSVTIYGREVK